MQQVQQGLSIESSPSVQKPSLLTGAWLIRAGLVVLVAAAIWLPRGFALDRFVTADEHAWLARAGNFYVALTHGDWAGTFQQHHPGVTVTWAGMAGFLWRFPAYARLAPGQFGWLTEEIEPFLQGQGHDPVELLAAGRSVVVLLITLALLVALALAARLFGLWPALIGLGLIAFDPFHIAHSRLLHLDGLVSVWMFLCLLAFLVYLENRRAAALLLSAVAAALAWLTRSPALVLAPLVSLLALGHWVGVQPAGENRPLRARRLLGALVLWGGCAALLFVLLWPAMWVDPWGNLARVLDAANAYAEEGHLKPTFFAGEVYNGDPGFSFYPMTYLWRSTPVVWIGLALALVAALARQAPLATHKARFAAAALVVYALLFLLFMNLGAKKFDRYLLPIYLPLDLVAGLGWAAAVGWLARRTRAAVPALLITGAIAAQALLALPTFPYYLSYYNPALGGAIKAPEQMMIGWGEGADQAAAFLNTLPDAETSVVASGYTNGPFSYFFRGQTLPIYFWHQADYAVLYAQDWQRQLPSRRVIDYFAQLTPLHVVTVDGLDYAHIYDLRNAPLPEYVTDWNDAIRLATIQLPAAAISPGEPFRAIFYFANRSPIATNLNVLVRIVGADGEEIARSEGWPWGSPTRAWQAGEVWPDGHEIAIPADAAPGYYKVELGFYDPATQALWPATRAATGELLGDLITVDMIQIGKPDNRPDLSLQPAPLLGDQVRLLGASWQDEQGQRLHLENAPLPPGQSLTLRLFWQAQAKMDLDYTVFVQVLGPQGSAVAQDDKQPLAGFLPTSAWYTGQIVADRYDLTLPSDAPPGEYRVITGMYDLATGQRLLVSRDGQTIGDYIELATFDVQ
jgi:hypothetical protein